jgi:hypothetical protein
MAMVVQLPSIPPYCHGTGARCRASPTVRQPDQRCLHLRFSPDAYFSDVKVILNRHLRLRVALQYGSALFNLFGVSRS